MLDTLLHEEELLQPLALLKWQPTEIFRRAGLQAFLARGATQSDEDDLVERVALLDCQPLAMLE